MQVKQKTVKNKLNNAINRLEAFNIKAKQIVEGFMIGLHKSPYHGFSVEFSEHRAYNPGDSANLIDWKLYARSNRYYVKRYEEETNLRCKIIVDQSASMQYGKNSNTKIEYAKLLAASLSYLMINQQDAVGIASYSENLAINIEPKASKSYLKIILDKLFSLKADGKTQTAKALNVIAERINKRGLVIIISDFLDNAEEIINGLKHFKHKKQEIIVFNIADEHERDFNFKGFTEFIDSETNEKIQVQPWQIKKEYLKNIEEHQNYLKQKCYENKIEYNKIYTDTPFEEALLSYLSKRKKLF